MKFNVFHNMKISKKISLTHSTIFLFLQIVICSILLLTIRLYYPIEASKDIKSLSSEINENIACYSNPITNFSLKENIPENSHKYNAFIRITDLTGNTITSYGTIKEMPDIKTPYGHISRINNKNIHLVYCNYLVPTKEKQEVILQIVFDITQNLQFNTVIFKVLIILTIVGFFISIFTGYIVGRVVLNPISNIIKTAKDIDAENLNMRIITNNTDDELYELSETINDMIARLQSSFVEQKQLISDVSHELRTPISVMKGYVSLMDRWGKEKPDILQESISRLSKEIENMSAIVEDLLFLAKKDSGTLNLDKIEFDISDLMEEIVEDVKAIKSDCDILIEQNDNCMYFGDYRLIKQMLRIIIDNSIKYSDGKCIIRICSKMIQNHIMLTIKDSGIGISKDDIAKIFDRFYRADKARTRNQGGTGLGLSIAKAIIDSHNGNIIAESNIGKGTKISISLPLYN